MGEVPDPTSQSGPMPEADAPHPDSMNQGEPWLIQNLLTGGSDIAAAYGWYILIGGTICYYLWINKIQPKISSINVARESAQHHKNPDLLISRERAAEEARRKLQEKYDKQAQEHAQVVKEQDDKRKQEKLEYMEAQLRGEGRTTLRKCIAQENEEEESKKNTMKKKPFGRPEYNPMMGAGGGTGFRAASRSMKGG